MKKHKEDWQRHVDLVDAEADAQEVDYVQRDEHGIHCSTCGDAWRWRCHCGAWNTDCRCGWRQDFCGCTDEENEPCP